MDFAARFINLTENLDRSEKVRSFNGKSEKEAETLALALLDSEESFKKIMAKIPKLESQNSDKEEIDETLHEIEVELKHILYHIYDSKRYRHLFEEIDPEDHQK